jgi:Cu+-exporting ATPase
VLVPVAQLLVTVTAAGVVAGLAGFFFGSRQAATAVERAGVQKVQVTVRSGYTPDVIRARAGVLLRIVFDRQEEGDCSARVVFPDLQRPGGVPGSASRQPAVDGPRTVIETAEPAALIKTGGGSR